MVISQYGDKHTVSIQGNLFVHRLYVDGKVVLTYGADTFLGSLRYANVDARKALKENRKDGGWEQLWMGW